MLAPPAWLTGAGTRPAACCCRRLCARGGDTGAAVASACFFECRLGVRCAVSSAGGGDTSRGGVSGPIAALFTLALLLLTGRRGGGGSGASGSGSGSGCCDVLSLRGTFAGFGGGCTNGGCSSSIRCQPCSAYRSTDNSSAAMARRHLCRRFAARRQRPNAWVQCRCPRCHRAVASAALCRIIWACTCCQWRITAAVL